MYYKYLPSLFLFLALAFAVVFHSYNMFGYPYFESDEGTYTSQAWAVVTKGDLAPYTYWYDHPPLGWITLALWTLLFKGGFFAFGSSIETGRVFMLVVHAASVALVYFIALRVTSRVLPAFAATLLFSLSPLAIYFQRRVLLDNMMIFWILAAIAVLFVSYKKIRLRHYIFSGLFFAFGVLTKVTAVMFGPALLFLLLTHKSPISRYFRTTLWFMVSGMVTSVYILYALLRSEFFKWTGEGPEHVSFLGALAFQSGRHGGHILDPTSDFRMTLADWISKDSIFIFAAFLVLCIPLFYGVQRLIIWLFRSHTVRPIPSHGLWVFLICILMYLLFLTRGGVTFNFYILPIIPFVGLCLSLFLHNTLVRLPRASYNALFLLVISGVLYYYFVLGPKNHFYANETQNQKNAVAWIKENIDNDAALLIDSYSYVDLHDGRYINGKEFPNADWYYKISRDPEIGEDKYNMNWRNFEYIGLTHEMMRQIREGDDPIVRTAFDNALPEKTWLQDKTAFVKFETLESTNGDWAAIYKINDSSRAVLLDSWKKYKSTFIALSGSNYGQVIDPEFDGTTSQGQAYAMMRAVHMYDREMFDGVWGWTRDHLQFRVEDRLFSSQWKDDAVFVSDNTTDADLDIAISLLFASNIWNSVEYRQAAQEIISDIWRQSVVEVGDTHYLIALNKKSALRGANQNEYLMNPSYFAPAWYRIFAEVDTDPSHDWLKLADDSYTVLNRISDASWNRSELPMNWVAINTTNGTVGPASRYIDQQGYANRFSYDAFRTLWRASIDRAWFEDDRAIAYIDRMNAYLAPLVEAGDEVPTVVNASGATQNVDSLAITTGYLSALMWYEDTDVPQAYYGKTLERSYDYDADQWGDGTNYYDANWAWLGSAVYNKKFVNLWETSLE